jgi:hypothetical protein
VNTQNIGDVNIFEELQNPEDDISREVKYLQEFINNHDK